MDGAGPPPRPERTRPLRCRGATTSRPATTTFATGPCSPSREPRPRPGCCRRRRWPTSRRRWPAPTRTRSSTCCRAMTRGPDRRHRRRRGNRQLAAAVPAAGGRRNRGRRVPAHPAGGGAGGRGRRRQHRPRSTPPARTGCLRSTRCATGPGRRRSARCCASWPSTPTRATGRTPPDRAVSCSCPAVNSGSSHGTRPGAPSATATPTTATLMTATPTITVRLTASGRRGRAARVRSRQAVFSYASSARQFIDAARQGRRPWRQSPCSSPTPTIRSTWRWWKSRICTPRTTPTARSYGSARYLLADPGAPGQTAVRPADVLDALPHGDIAGASVLHFGCHGLVRVPVLGSSLHLGWDRLSGPWPGEEISLSVSDFLRQARAGRAQPRGGRPRRPRRRALPM